MLMFEAEDVEELVDYGTDTKATLAKWISLEVHHLRSIPEAQVIGVAAHAIRLNDDGLETLFFGGRLENNARICLYDGHSFENFQIMTATLEIYVKPVNISLYLHTY